MTDEFIPMAIPYIGEEEANAVYQQIKSGWITMGKRVEEFESKICEYTGAKHAIAFNTGTGTLHAALLAVGVQPGDEVLVPAMSYISSANAVLYCNASPVFVEEDPVTFNVDVKAFEAKITDKTKAIMTVDLKGMSVDYDAIMEMAKKRGIPVVADSAESFGGSYKGKKIGSQADVHSFSMFANKSITTGEGGAVTTNDDKIAEICRIVRNQGQSERYVHVMVGHNYRMTDITAAFGLEQLKRVDWFISEKTKIVNAYNKAFASHELITTPYVPEFVSQHSWYMYCLILDDKVNRDKVLEYMRSKGVDSRLSFPLIPLQPIYKEMFGYKDGDFPISEKIFKSFMDIPCWVGMNESHYNKVIKVVKEAVEACVE